MSESIKQLVESASRGDRQPGLLKSDRPASTPPGPILADLKLFDPERGSRRVPERSVVRLPPRVSRRRSAISDVLADTHSVVWFLFDTARALLPTRMRCSLTTASESGKLYISAITPDRGELYSARAKLKRFQVSKDSVTISSSKARVLPNVMSREELHHGLVPSAFDRGRARRILVNEERVAHPELRVREKMLVLWLLHCGHKREEAAKIVGVSRTTVHRYVVAFRVGGSGWPQVVRPPSSPERDWRLIAS